MSRTVGRISGTSTRARTLGVSTCGPTLGVSILGGRAASRAAGCSDDPDENTPLTERLTLLAVLAMPLATLDAAEPIAEPAERAMSAGIESMGSESFNQWGQSHWSTEQNSKAFTTIGLISPAI